MNILVYLILLISKCLIGSFRIGYLCRDGDYLPPSKEIMGLATEGEREKK